MLHSTNASVCDKGRSPPPYRLVTLVTYAKRRCATSSTAMPTRRRDLAAIWRDLGAISRPARRRRGSCSPRAWSARARRAGCAIGCSTRPPIAKPHSDSAPSAAGGSRGPSPPASPMGRSPGTARGVRCTPPPSRRSHTTGRAAAPATCSRSRARYSCTAHALVPVAVHVPVAVSGHFRRQPRSAETGESNSMD